jgi:uncharacterized protein
MSIRRGTGPVRKEEIMKTIRAFIERHPLLSFYTVAFAIAWGGLIVVVGGPGEILGTPENFETRFAFVLLAWLAGPSVASLLMTGLVHGRAGFRDLLARMTRWRVGVRWWGVALLTAPLLVIATLLALALTSPAYLPTILTTSDKAALLLLGIVGTIVGGIFEELGWTGFATAMLLRLRYGVLATGLIVGVLWGVAHFPIYYWASGDLSGALWPALLLAAQILAWFPAYRVLMVWVYDRTGGSLLLAMLMHASLTASQVIFASLATAMPLFIYSLVFGAVVWVVVVAVALANHGHLSRQPLRKRVA